jgi:hypothetical protein
MADDSIGGSTWRARAPVLPLLVTLAYVLSVVLTEKIQIHSGLGWDGSDYGAWAADFPAALQRGFDAYYAQRVLPSALVYVALGALGLARTTPQIIVAFEVANVVLVALSAFSYDSVARSLRASVESRWWGAVGLFASFAILKYSAFYPVLTDVWAFAFGMLQLQFFWKRQLFALAGITLLGSFAWPTLLPVGACLCLLHQPSAEAAEPRPAPAHLNDVLAGLISASWVWVCLPKAREGFSLDLGTGTIDLTVVRLSLLVSTAFLFWGARQLLDQRCLFEIRAYRQASSWYGASCAAAVALIAVFARAHITSRPAKFGLQSNIDQAVFSALKEPGIFALSHVLFWGPWVLIVLFSWRHCVAALHRAGLGLTLVALFGVVLSLNGESRKLANFAPLFCLSALPHLDRLGLHKRQVIGFGVAALLFSRVWLEFDGRMPGKLFAFPSQLLFMVIGPWMTPTNYAAQLALVAAGAIPLFFWLRQRAAARATP